MKPTPKLSWQDRVRQVNQFHVEKLKATGNKWRIEDTALAFNMSNGMISEYITLANWLKTHSNQLERKTLKEAIEFVRLRKREMRLEL